MPWSYEIVPAERLVVSHFHGVVTDADVDEHERTVPADPAFDPCFRQLVDLSEVERITFGFAKLRSAAEHPIFEGRQRRAILAPKDMVFGLARTYEAYSGIAGQNVHVFRERSEAIRWLSGPTPE